MLILSSESGQVNNQINIGDIPNLEATLESLSNDIIKITEDIKNLNIDLISSEENNKIKINEDKTLSVNRITTDKLINGKEVLILNGGTA